MLCGGVVVGLERGKRKKAEHVNARRQFILENNTLAGAEKTRGRKTLGFLLLGLTFTGPSRGSASRCGARPVLPTVERQRADPGAEDFRRILR